MTGAVTLVFIEDDRLGHSHQPPNLGALFRKALIFLPDDGTVVVEGSGRERCHMDSAAIPIALKDRLGPEATDGLLQLVHRLETDLREDVITACTERFERRLVEETSALRVQIAQVESSIRQDMTRLGSDLRQEIGALGSQMASDRFDLLKWAFLFWIGQVVAIGTLIGVMMRMTGWG